MPATPQDIERWSLSASCVLCVASCVFYWDTVASPVLAASTAAASVALVRLSSQGQGGARALLCVSWLQAVLLGVNLGQRWHGSGLLWPAAALSGAAHASASSGAFCAAATGDDSI